MDSDDPIKCGYLILPPNKKKKPQRKFYCLHKASKLGIARLEVFENSDLVGKSDSKILPLNNCIKITHKTATVFGITTKTDVYEFEALDESDKNSWIEALQSVIFPDDSSKITSIEEDNDLYCSSGDGIYFVKILSTPVSVACGLDNKQFTLIINPMELQLKNYAGKTLFTWPYHYIRKYGIKNGKFTFEAGRKCSSGDGIFLIDHPNHDEIFRSVSSKMKSMKNRLSAEVDSEFPCVSMEARSRSPLSPAADGFTSFSDSRLESVIKSKLPTPSKPPRKLLMPPKPTSIPDPDYEPINTSYDEIEYRNNAWRTMGVDDINHTECEAATEPEEIYNDSWGKEKPQKILQQSKPSNLAPTVITQKSVTDDNYDTLDFFSSTTKLATNSSYKQVNPPPIAPVIEPPSFNEYDEVETCLQGVRLADDSHLGYASIRKEPPKQTPVPKKTNKKDVHHQFHNDEPYAVISKPKQV